MAIKPWEEHSPEDKIDLENEVLDTLIEYGQPLNVAGFLLYTFTFIIDGFDTLILKVFLSLEDKGKIMRTTHPPTDMEAMFTVINS